MTGFEDAASDDLSSENAEEDFDLIEPTGIALDKGEEALWAHALGRDNGWFLYGPDKANLDGRGR